MIKEPSSNYLIRFSDCDMFGHLNNARYFDYFNNARQDHLKQAYQLDLNDFYQQGVGWVTATHNISYLKPAAFNEVVCIQSTLIKANEEYLLVEFLMMDEKKSHIKAILWTKFVSINIKTGKKEMHPAKFMDFARSIQNEHVDMSKGISQRLSGLLAAIKTTNIKP